MLDASLMELLGSRSLLCTFRYDITIISSNHSGPFSLLFLHYVPAQTNRNYLHAMSASYRVISPKLLVSYHKIETTRGHPSRANEIIPC
jgi:hypothetical protein